MTEQADIKRMSILQLEAEIVEKEPYESILSMLAEECSECAHASLKLARIRRKESPTPESEREVREHLIEEVSDVMNIISILSDQYEYELDKKICVSFDIMKFKLRRWVRRLREKENDQNTN